MFQFAWNEVRHMRLPGRSHLSPQEKDLRGFRLFGTVFAILSSRRSFAQQSVRAPPNCAGVPVHRFGANNCYFGGGIVVAKTRRTDDHADGKGIPGLKLDHPAATRPDARRRALRAQSVAAQGPS
jgi:hypothetical protein